MPRRSQPWRLRDVDAIDDILPPEEPIRRRSDPRSRAEPLAPPEDAPKLDTTDVRVDDPDRWITPGEPAWVIRRDYVQEDLGTVKTGKEANVTLVERRADGCSCLLAVKTYRPRAERAFRREEDYRAGQSFGDERVDRAVARRSRFGRSVLEYAWAWNEYPLLRTAWEAGVRVPYPVEATDDGLAMQYIGDHEQAAPRLAEVRFTPLEAQAAFEQVLDQMRRMLDAYLVHGDLSAFNILWWEDRPWLIDFPQAVDLVRSRRSLEFLRRDVQNVCAWFSRRGVDVLPGEVFEELLRDSPLGGLVAP